jgi:magnesium transporter
MGVTTDDPELCAGGQRVPTSRTNIPLRPYQKRSHLVGQSPGTLAAFGEMSQKPTGVTLIDYDHQKCEKHHVERLSELQYHKDSSTNSWINVESITDTKIVAEIGQIFDIHPLVLEDIVDPEQRIKIEVYDNYIFIVLKMITYSDESELFIKENVSLILGKQFLILFHEESSDIFEAIHKRIQREGSRLRTFGCDYLAYHIIDLIVDHYFVVIEKQGEKIEQLEIQLNENPDSDLLTEIKALKKELLLFFGAIFPLGDVLKGLMKEDIAMITDESRIFLGNVKDHFLQAIYAITTAREIVADMLSGYLSMMSYKMNEVMRILTIFAVTFIPLTFIAGVYGMNFDFMPELHFKDMYPIVWLFMIGIVISLLVYFKRKKWF